MPASGNRRCPTPELLRCNVKVIRRIVLDICLANLASVTPIQLDVVRSKLQMICLRNDITRKDHAVCLTSLNYCSVSSEQLRSNLEMAVPVSGHIQHSQIRFSKFTLYRNFK